jgi:hypothetical protein
MSIGEKDEGWKWLVTSLSKEGINAGIGGCVLQLINTPIARESIQPHYKYHYLYACCPRGFLTREFQSQNVSGH